MNNGTTFIYVPLVSDLYALFINGVTNDTYRLAQNVTNSLPIDGAASVLYKGYNFTAGPTVDEDIIKTTFPINSFNTTFLTTWGNLLNASVINQWHTIKGNSPPEATKIEVPQTINQIDSSGK